ncbi:hypothetical protein ACH3O9_11175 [Leeuwenhoekiella sp. A16]|uniref:hypothetical protein n=1 Tax=Leeuwenhoekiella sp. A16 TaxID=3141462 RepID=UPI003A805404
MSKIYHCNNGLCASIDLDTDNWLTIGSKNGKSLKIKNNLKGKKQRKKSQQDLHFCSIECLTNFFNAKTI